MIKNKNYIFNNKRYKDHKALSSLDNFYKDKVYLYKIHKYINEINFKDRSRIKILEVGCADGSFINLLNNDGFKVCGIDISENTIDIARKLNIEATCSDVEEGINYPNNSFDIVIASEVIEHLYDTDYFLQELFRVAKDKGYLFISTPNLVSFKNRIRMLFGLYPHYSEYRLGEDSAGHIRSYTTKVLKKQLESNGWKVVKIASPNFFCPMTKNIPFFIKKIAIKLGDFFYNSGSHVVIKAVKKYE